LRDANGKVINEIAVIRDVTERRDMERHLLQAQRFEAIGSLAGGIAHEINTPTQYVGDNVRFLADGLVALGRAMQQSRALADAARAHSELAGAVATFDDAVIALDVDYLMSEMPIAAAHSAEGCDRITDIVKAMQGFSHPEGTHKRFVDLNAAVRDTVTVCRNEWKYVATLATELDTTMPPVPCLPGELQQVVLNLIVNAAHAIAEKVGTSGALGRIMVSTRLDGNRAEIRVQDDGGGIPESIQARVFDPFFTTRAIGKGMGQGLSMGHATIVGKHHGTLTFESSKQHGTTFVIRLPLDDRAEGGEAA
jgi:two-component system, NtrC family, sensor kinase